MEIIGKLRQLLPEQRGESARGPWVRGGFVIDLLDSQYPRSIAFSTWGEDMLSQLKSLRIGDTIQVIFEIESRPWQDRWFTECRCRSIGAFVSANNQGGGNPYNQPVQNNTTAQPTYQQPNANVNDVAQTQPNTPVNTEKTGGGNIETDSMDGADDDLPF